ncbi:homeotic protein female sterile-like [Mytilus trossulus]|uniref:homeotic protein female sterile-like n=1 Tax=Mytilus trossulus TaxID=6551 RepID=UPI003004426B
MSNAAELDNLIQSFEYENQQYIKLIEKESQHIEAIESDIHVRRGQADTLQHEIAQLDEDTKRAHKQFMHNRDNVENLKKTIPVLKDHEVALEKTLKSLIENGNQTRKEREAMLQHYRDVWKDYEAKYKSFPLAQELEAKKQKVRILQNELNETEERVRNLQKQIQDFNSNHDVDFKDMKKLIIKIAELKTGTSEVVRKIKHAYEEKKVIDEEIKKAKEKKLAQEEASRLEQEKLNESMDLEEKDTSHDTSDSSALISMMRDDEPDINGNFIIEKQSNVLSHSLEQAIDQPQKASPSFTEQYARLNKVTAPQRSTVSSPENRQQSLPMETDVTSPSQIHLEFAVQNAKMKNLDIQRQNQQNVSQPQVRPQTYQVLSPQQQFTPMSGQQMSQFQQQFTRPSGQQSSQSQQQFTRPSGKQMPQVQQQFTQPTGQQMSQFQQIGRPYVPQGPSHLLNKSEMSSLAQTIQKQTPRPFVPQSTTSQATRPSVPQYNYSPMNRNSAPQNTNQQIYRNPQNLNEQMYKNLVPQIKSQFTTRSAVPQIVQRPETPKYTHQQVTRPLQQASQVQKYRQVAPQTQPPQTFEAPRTPQLQMPTRQSPVTLRPNTPNVANLPLTDQVRKMTPSKQPGSKVQDQSPRKPLPQSSTTAGQNKQNEQLDINGNPYLNLQQSPKTPKTPEHMLAETGSGDFSPFDMEKHRQKLQKLKQSPGQPMREARPMYSAEKVDSSKETEPGIFMGVQSIFDTKSTSKTGSAADNNINFSGFATEMSMFQSGGGGNMFPSAGDGGGEKSNFFGSKSPDLGTADSGFSFGAADKSGGSSIMSLFGSSNSEDDTQETSFSFSFGGGGGGDQSGGSPGFSFGGADKSGGASIMSLFGGGKPEEKTQESNFSFSF